LNGSRKTRIFDWAYKTSYIFDDIYFSKIPAKRVKLIIPLKAPKIKPKVLFNGLNVEKLLSNRNKRKLVINLKMMMVAMKIKRIENVIIIVPLMLIYLEMMYDSST
tara:strand:- start:404 stop:721 length:318 start_codon:yes stop_codon:yes gene_type:complete